LADTVLDSSVILAVLQGEIPSSTIESLLEGAAMSAVNLCEIHSKLHDYGLRNSPRTDAILALLSGIHPFTSERARHAVSLRESTRAAGLSLGDRACIALAIELDADVYTADHAWVKVNLPCRVHLIR
jgi:ribonuclease VapC